MGFKQGVESDITERPCLANCAKYFLFVINIIASAVGGFFLGYGALLLIGLCTGSGQISNFMTIAFIVGGSIVILLANLALQGAYRENIKLLKIYAWILLVLIVLRMVSFILYFATGRYKHGFVDIDDFKQAYALYGVDPTITQALDGLQQTLHCCGLNGPESMVYSNGSYPVSCCLLQTQDCTVPFLDGCSTHIEEIMSPINFWYNIALYVVPAFEILCMASAFYLISFLKKKSRCTPYNNF